MANTVVDVFALVDTETGLSAAASSTSEDRKVFKALLEDCEKFLPEGTLKERMEIDTLGEVGVIKAPKKFFNTVIKLKTKLLSVANDLIL